MAEKKSDLTEEEMENIIALGEVLRGIHNRLLKEGKIKIENGKIIWPEIIKNEKVKEIIPRD